MRESKHRQSFCIDITEEIAYGTHWIGGWEGPRAGLDALEKKKKIAMPRIEPGASNS
jgi:hypothetical protein